ncbi:MAG: multicopper oxidase domain-containing protein [Bacteroidota bacterium]
MKRNVLTTLVFILLISKMATAQKFINRVYAPPAIRNTNTFNISIDSANHNFNPNGGTDSTNATVPTFCYNQMDSNNISYLGPTMFWQQGQQVTINAFNNLTQRTTMHFHGLNLPSNMDGGPHEIIESNSMWDMPVVPSFKIIDPIQTVWYHSHLMDSTTMQVAMGLAGMIIIENPTDAVKNKLPHDYGVNDFPIVVQEKKFNFTNHVATSMVANSRPGPGNYLMVNGLLYGAMHVPNEVVRLRFLNGSPISSLSLGINDSIAPVSNPNDSMWLVATDGGYTPKAFPMQSIIIAPGERMEMLVNCTGKQQGDTIYLQNLANTIPADIISGPAAFPFMALVIDTTLKAANKITSIPDSLESYPIIDTTNAFKRAPKRLYGNGGGGSGGGPVWTIDSMPMDMELMNDTILVGTTEIWTIENKTNKAHPFHIHKVQFQVLDIDSAGIKQSVYNNTLPKHLMGYKDDVLIRAGTTLRFIAQFDHYGDTLMMHNQIDMMSGFMYHCHILTHEDSAMMHQFVVLDTASYNKVTGKHISIKESTLTEKANLAFYPNPAGNVLNIKGYTVGKGSIRFIDVLGRTIKEENIAAINGNTSIQVDDLPRGFVFVEYVSGNTRMVQKILLQ